MPDLTGARQTNARLHDAPKYTLRGRLKPLKEACHETPGAKYEPPRGMGKQPDSGFRSEPSYGIAGRARVPMDPGKNSPGPIYNLPSSLEKQVASSKRAAPRPSFTRTSRWADHEAELRKNTVPGPGYYG